MEYKRPFDAFAQSAHDKAQAAIDHAREVREQRIADGKKTASGPRLITNGSVKRCSAFGYPFQSDEKPSMSVAFADHLRKAHELGQTSEDANSH